LPWLPARPRPSFLDRSQTGLWLLTIGISVERQLRFNPSAMRFFSFEETVGGGARIRLPESTISHHRDYPLNRWQQHERNVYEPGIKRVLTRSEVHQPLDPFNCSRMCVARR